MSLNFLSQLSLQDHRCHSHDVGQIVEPDLLSVMMIDIFINLAYPPAIGIILDMGKGGAGECMAVVTKREFVKDGQQLYYGMKTGFLCGKGIKHRINLHDGFHGEVDTFLCITEHLPNTAKLILVNKVTEKEVFRKLDGNFPDIFGGALMLFPYVF